MTPIERGAQAIADAYGEDWDKVPEHTPNVPGIDRKTYREMATAVLAAIREPSEAMLEAYIEAANDMNGPAAMQLDVTAYQAMIDAALAEKV